MPKVNAEVWRKMSSRAKSRDLNFQKAQGATLPYKRVNSHGQCLQFLRNWRRKAKNNADRSVHISDIECLKLLQISAILFLCYHTQTINYVCVGVNLLNQS